MNDLDHLKRLTAEASPGPWTASESRPHRGFVRDGGELIADVFCGASRGHGYNNAAFIAEARTAVPALIDRVEQLEAALATTNANYARLVSKAQQFERYAGGEGARRELRAALDKLGQLDADRKLVPNG